MLPELLQAVVRADRVLSNPSSRSLLLIGRSGVGRHTTMKLLSVMHHARIITPYPGRNYGRKQFTSDLKSVRIRYSIKIAILSLRLLTEQAMLTAGVDGDLVYFVLEDHHISDGSFYSMIDSLLASGEVRKKSLILIQYHGIQLQYITCFFIRFQASTQTKKSMPFLHP